MPEFCNELYVHPHVSCPAYQHRLFLSLKEVIPESQPAFTHPSSLQHHAPQDSSSWGLNKPESGVLKTSSEPAICLVSFSQHPQAYHPMVTATKAASAFTSLTTSSLFARLRSNRAPFLIPFSVTCVSKLPPMHSKHLLDCLYPPVFFSRRWCGWSALWEPVPAAWGFFQLSEDGLIFHAFVNKMFVHSRHLHHTYCSALVQLTPKLSDSSFLIPWYTSTHPCCSQAVSLPHIPVITATPTPHVHFVPHAAGITIQSHQECTNCPEEVRQLLPLNADLITCVQVFPYLCTSVGPILPWSVVFKDFQTTTSSSWFVSHQLFPPSVLN